MTDDTQELEAPPQESPDQKKRITHQILGWKAFLLWPISLVIKLWLASLRIDLSPEHRLLLCNAQRPIVYVFWHNEIIVAVASRRFRPSRRLCALVSASKDGAWLTAVFKHLGLETARGSSSWRGAQAIRELIRALRAGFDVGITPDGPRGPLHVFNPGAALVALKSGAPIIVMAAKIDRAWTLNSWDRFKIPKPFARVTLHCETLTQEAIPYKRPKEAAEWIKGRLDALHAAANP